MHHAPRPDLEPHAAHELVAAAQAEGLVHAAWTPWTDAGSAPTDIGHAGSLTGWSVVPRTSKLIRVIADSGVLRVQTHCLRDHGSFQMTAEQELEPASLAPWLDARIGLRSVGGDGGGAAPIGTGWIGLARYELGFVFEPSAAPAWFAGSPTPLLDLVRFEHALLQDPRGAWTEVGGQGLLARPRLPRHETSTWISPPTPGVARERFHAAVARTVEYIHAGDVFQVNLSHRLRAVTRANPRGVFRAMQDIARARHAGFFATPVQSVLSVSPELFLEFDPRDRVLTTRPMKGTRPGSADPDELTRSAKDRAELAMIIDLMRNDLSRVCGIGSVRVDSPHDVETHARTDAHHGILQATGTVRGTLCEGVGLGSLLAATFPPGSITGAPKVRAMQIIDELESSTALGPRGPYTGSMFWADDSGSLVANVCIRTADVQRGEIAFGVGAGIVSDSDPASEWDETLTKGHILNALARRGLSDAPRRVVLADW